MTTASADLPWVLAPAAGAFCNPMGLRVSLERSLHPSGIESRSDGLLLYMLVITYYPFIVAVVGMLVGCLAAFAGCGLARLGRGDTNGARLTALRWAFDGVVVCAALRGVWLAATVIINIRRHN